MIKISNSDLMKCYPGLFQEINGELFFHDDFEIIGDCPLIISQWAAHYDLTPEIHQGSTFQFRLTMPNEMDDPDILRSLRVSVKTLLPDDVCIKLFAYKINIIGYDQDVITRRHTIDNIIK